LHIDAFSHQVDVSVAENAVRPSSAAESPPPSAVRYEVTTAPYADSVDVRAGMNRLIARSCWGAPSTDRIAPDRFPGGRITSADWPNVIGLFRPAASSAPCTRTPTNARPILTRPGRNCCRADPNRVAGYGDAGDEPDRCVGDPGLARAAAKLPSSDPCPRAGAGAAVLERVGRPRCCREHHQRGRGGQAERSERRPTRCGDLAVDSGRIHGSLN